MGIEIRKGIFNLQSFEYMDTGIPFIRISNIAESSMNWDNCVYISEISNEREKNTQLFAGDLVFAKIGTIDRVGMLDNSYPVYNMSQNVIGAKLSKINPKILPEYINIIFKLDFGKSQLIKYATFGVQLKLTLDALRSIEIPLPPLEIQKQIVSIMDNAYTEKKDKEAKAQELLDSIDDYVLGELGIEIPKVENKMCFVVESDEIEGRIDSFYYKNEFIENIKVISNGLYKTTLLKHLVKEMIKGKLPNENEKNGNNRVIQISSIDSNGNINLEDLLTAKDIFLPNQILQVNDILIVITGATIGKIAIWNYLGDYYLGGDLVKINVNENINSQYIYSYLKTRTAQTEIKRNITGATNGHLSPNDILNFIIPIPPLDIQTQISGEVKRRMNEAERLKKEASDTLEKAKQEVERMILE